MTIYAGNLHFSVTEDDLKTMFSPYGDVLGAKIAKDKETGRSRGFGFVEMEESEAKEAILQLNGTTHKSRVLKINEARPKEFK
ncbi:MAG: RNA-binding protein [Bacteroidia bacterium]|nr:RNA-binding protein [Bacteroidia bacterium]